MHNDSTQSHEGIEDLLIRSVQGDYGVHFVATIRGAIEKLLDGTSRDIRVVLDEGVNRKFSSELKGLEDFPTYIVEPSEFTKSLDGIERLCRWLVDQESSKSSVVIAVGGGCIQDLVSFTTSIFLRGIDWVFLPTTLLSQSDSCIGAKSGINLLPYKNQLGAFWSPRRVIVANEFLSGLPSGEIDSGLGEIVKMSVTSSLAFLSDLEQWFASQDRVNSNFLSITKKSLAAKREIIEADEQESDLRRVLNYGHTFGHALETLTNHSIPHGIAVLWGIDVINRLGVRWDITDPSVATRIVDLTSEWFQYELPFRPTADQLLSLIRRDKKVVGKTINFAVLEHVGKFRIHPVRIDATLLDHISSVLSENYVFRTS